MNDDQLLLASRYLDNDLPADERAAVEADPELLAEVERMRAVRAAIGDVPLPSDEQRDAAVAAALAARPGAPSVVPIPRRRTPRWLLPAAAAIVGVLALGGAAALLGNGDGDDSGGDAAEAPAPEAADTATPSSAGEELLADLSGTAAPGGGADDGDDAPTTSVAAEMTAAAAAPTAGGTTGELGYPVLATPGELTDFARGEFARAEQQLSVPSDAAREFDAAVACDLGEPVGPAYYRVDEEDVLVLVVEDADEALAVIETCEVVARAPLP